MSVLLSSAAGIQDAGDGEGRTALMWAAQRGNYAVLKTLLQAGCDPNAVDRLGASGQSLIHVHVHRCYTLPPSPLSAALHAAALSGHANCVQLLLQVLYSLFYSA